jgi:CHAD domain-containing protein
LRLAQDAPSQQDRQYAALILGWDEGRPIPEVGEQVGFSQSWSYELIARFREERLSMFGIELEGKPEGGPERAIVPDEETADGAPVERQGQVSAPPVDTGAVSVETLCTRYQVDLAHARHVTETALLLFDRTEPIHHLGEERRRLLAVMGMLHNVGLEEDPDRHHVRGREIVLENHLEGLTEMEQRMLAAAVFLHRKRARRRKLETGIVASLPLGVRRDALVLAALVRMADGLDASQSQSTSVNEIQVRPSAIQVVASGPSGEVDISQAQARADLWEMLFENAPFYFGGPGADLYPGAGLEDGNVGPVAEAGIRQSPGITPDEPMSEAGRKVLAFHFARMLEHEPGTRAGEDIEELHDMRVATRRMRSALRVFGPYYQSRAIRPFVAGLRRTARALGRVRDLDVFLQKAATYLDGLGGDRSHDLDVLLAAWQEQRAEARARMLDVLDSAKYGDFVDAFALFIESAGAGARESGGIPPRPTLVRHVAPKLIYDRWARVHAFGLVLEGAPISVLHALRIECKRLRYTLEFFAEVLAPSAGDVIEAVVKLQDHLGDLNDADVANAMLSDFLFAGRTDQGGERLIAPGVVAYLAFKQRELQSLIETFPQAWERFTQPAVRKALADAVAIL